MAVVEDIGVSQVNIRSNWSSSMHLRYGMQKVDLMHTVLRPVRTSASITIGFSLILSALVHIFCVCGFSTIGSRSSQSTSGRWIICGQFVMLQFIRCKLGHNTISSVEQTNALLVWEEDSVQNQLDGIARNETIK